MTKLTKINPEGFDIANAYLTYGSVEDTAEQLSIPRHDVVQALNKPDVKAYINGVYLDLGYRNRSKLGQVLDRAIDSKLEEAEETGVYSDKDLLELLQFAHKMRMDEIKAEKTSNTVNIAQFGGQDSNYDKLMQRLLNKE